MIDSTINQDKLAGIWQENTAVVADALLKNFQFFRDGSYTLNYSEYDDTKRTLSLGGHYRLAGNKLFMTVESRKEIIGGDFIKGSPGFQREEFVLDSGKVEVVKQNDSSGSDPFLISVCGFSKSGKITCVKIDNNKYYKLSADPRHFETHH
jgi:hypothetical protein